MPPAPFDVADDDAAAAAETQLLNDSVELMAQSAPAMFTDEEDFLKLVAQQREPTEDDACESFFAVANALAGTHVRRPNSSARHPIFGKPVLAGDAILFLIAADAALREHA